MEQEPSHPNFSMPGGYRLISLARVDSTNEEARRRIAAGEGPNAWIMADEQSRGRGRRGRLWVSAPGNLYASLMLRPGVALAKAAQLSFVSALAVHDAVAGLLPKDVTVQCKWPNDILLGGNKVAGILLESLNGRAEGSWVIIGIGVNVVHFPENTEFPATSLLENGYAGFATLKLMAAVAARFNDWLTVWQTRGFDPVREAWKARAAGLGQPIRVRLQDSELKGVFEDIGPGGELMLAMSDGVIKTIAAGDVFF